MKKILFFLCLFLFPSVAFAALNADTVWEVRTSGASTNGGGYHENGGSDYSQQDAAQLSLTDLAMSTGGVTLTSVTGGFTAAMVGNIINISAGANFTVGFYEVASYTDTNTVTLDRDATNGSSGEGGTGAVGGAIDHPATIAPLIVAGNTIYIEGGTYTPVGANSYVLSVTIDSSPDNIIKWIGYKADTGRTTATGTDRPTLDSEGDTAYVLNIAESGVGLGQNNIFENLILKRGTAAIVNSYIPNGYSASFYNVRMTLGGSDAFNWGSSPSWKLVGCEIDLMTGSGADDTSAVSWLVIDTYIHDNGDYGILTTSSITSIGTVYDSNSSTGLRCGSGYIVVANAFYNNTGETSDGFSSYLDGTHGYPILNSISLYNGRYGFNRESTADVTPSHFDYNCYYLNGTAGLNNIVAGENDVVADPLFDDAAGGDFGLQAGSPCLNVGLDYATYSTAL